MSLVILNGVVSLCLFSFFFLFIRHKPSRFPLHLSLPSPSHSKRMFLFPLVFQLHIYWFILFHCWCLRRDCTLMLSPVLSQNGDGCFLLLLLNYLFLPLSLLSPCPDNCRRFPVRFHFSLSLLLFSIRCIK